MQTWLEDHLIEINHIYKAFFLRSDFRSVSYCSNRPASHPAWDLVLWKEQSHLLNSKNPPDSQLYYHDVVFPFIRNCFTCSVISFFFFNNKISLLSDSNQHKYILYLSSVLLILICIADNIWPCCYVLFLTCLDQWNFQSMPQTAKGRSVCYPGAPLLAGT